MTAAKHSGSEATPAIAVCGPQPNLAAGVTRPAISAECRDSGYFDTSASNTPGSPRLALSAAPAFMQDGAPPVALDEDNLADRPTLDKSSDTDSTTERWSQEIASDKAPLFPEYHPVPLQSESARWIRRVKEMTLRAIFGRRAMARRGKRKARARKIRPSTKTTGPDKHVPMASGALMSQQPVTEAERAHLAKALSTSLRSRPRTGPPRPCSCGTPDHSESSCIVGV
ncbi:hypothetical protein JDV02_003984 [Purpureocillium takamizusanense]|uniref:Uncharacterized protein n=1 Tax=Purpureocillium takamizusanense TaxID=2060973 RepID=A0A9Q8QEW8_9HYPO|nr:uncharacterized protein JDV02_003984 [Purpureocillium takamizusanense]UNI17656.1 hypothetical protein JDV02_003984 [Purpureocillium takamizusanense]